MTVTSPHRKGTAGQAPSSHKEFSSAKKSFELLLGFFPKFNPQDPQTFPNVLKPLSKQLALGKKLHDAYRALPHRQKEELQGKIGKQELQEILALSQETDKELFWNKALNLGQRLVAEEKLDPGLGILGRVSQDKSSVPPAIQKKAENEFNSVVGKGGVINRMEFLTSRFVSEATDYKMIVPMMAGSFVYQLTRTAMLGNLAGASRVKWYTQGFAARFFAGTVGFAAEVPVFSLSSQGLRYMAGDPVGPMGQELAGAGITLGFLKGFGFAGQKGFQRLHGISAQGAMTRLQGLSKISQPIIPQASMFLGLLAAHGFEAKIGLRPHVDGATMVTDTLGSLFSLGIGARLGHRGVHAVFPGMENYSQYLALRTKQNGKTAQAKSFSSENNQWDSLFGLRPALAIQGKGRVGPNFESSTPKMIKNLPNSLSESLTEGSNGSSKLSPASLTANTIWGRLNLALQAAREWKKQDSIRLTYLQQVLMEAEGNPEKIPSAEAGEILKVLQDKRSKSFFGTRRAEQKSRVQALQQMLKKRVEATPPAEKEEAAKKPASEKTAVLKPNVPKSIKPRGKRRIHFRDYQVKFLSAADQAMRASVDPITRWNPLRPRDRGYILSPWQTGKTLLIGPMAEIAKKYFPGKKTLVLIPFKIVKKQIHEDLMASFDGKVSVFDDKQKDLSGDIIVASVFSLIKLIKSPKPDGPKLNPKDIGFVAIDEMPFVMAGSWQGILRHLGFLDGRGRPTHAKGKFSLGLGATGERNDGQHVRDFFGNTLLAARGLRWFIKQKHMHDILGLEVPYGRSDIDWEQIKDGEETVVVMRNTPENRKRITDTYERYLKGERSLVFVDRIKQADDLAEDFNKIYGEGYAAAITSEMSDGAVNRILDAYNSGEGPKVLVSIRKIALSFRALNTSGVIHGYQTESWNLFAQRSTRPLARQEGEPQRTVLIITMEGRGIPLDRAQNAKTLLGDYSKAPRKRIYRPLEESQKRKIRAKGVRRRVKSTLLHVGPEKIQKLKVKADQFGQAMREVLEEVFQGEIILMAEKGELSLAETDAFLQGMLPRTYDRVFQLSQKFGVDYRPLTEVWLSDQLALLDAAYRLPEGAGPAQANLTQLVRLAILRQSKTGGFTKQGQNYQTLVDAFKGRPSTFPKSLRKFFELIVDSGAAEETEARFAIGKYVEERYERDPKFNKISFKSQRNPLKEHTDNEFDHRHVDALQGEDKYSYHRISDELPLLGRNSLSTTYQRDIFEHFEEIFNERNHPFLKKSIRRVVFSLTPREDRVIQRAFGLDGVPEHTLEEQAMDWETTHERIRQIKAKALRKLRHPMRSKRLNPYFESDVGNPSHIGRPERVNSFVDLFKDHKKYMQNLPIQVVGFSQSISEAIRSAGIPSLRFLTPLSKRALQFRTSLGPPEILEVKKVLRELGLTLGRSFSWRPWGPDFKSVLDRPVDQPWVPANEVRALQEIGINSIKDVSNQGLKQVLSRGKIGIFTVNNFSRVLERLGLRMGMNWDRLYPDEKYNASLLELGVGVLDLSVRSEKALQDAKIGTLEELVSSTGSEILKRTGSGKVFVEIKEALADIGLSLGIGPTAKEILLSTPFIGLGLSKETEEDLRGLGLRFIRELLSKDISERLDKDSYREVEELLRESGLVF